MVRVSNNLRQAAKLLLCCAAIAGCGGSDSSGEEAGTARQNLILFSPMYSAFGGSQTYSLTPSIPAADPATKDSDPVMASSVKWAVDDKFAKQEEFADLPGGRKLTTKQAGNTVVKVSATTVGGVKIKGEAKLTISKANDEEWAAGDMRYSGGTTIDFQAMFGRGMMMAAGGMGSCGLPIDIGGQLPKTSACTNCHNTMANAISVEHTPTQTAGYSDEQLIGIFTQGMKPAGFTFNSFFLKMLPQPDCVYAKFHTWDIDDATKKGIVWKLRSIAPRKQDAVDIGKIIQMGMAARAMNMAMTAGAAGAPAM